MLRWVAVAVGLGLLGCAGASIATTGKPNATQAPLAITTGTSTAAKSPTPTATPAARPSPAPASSPTEQSAATAVVLPATVPPETRAPSATATLSAVAAPAVTQGATATAALSSANAATETLGPTATPAPPPATTAGAAQEPTATPSPPPPTPTPELPALPAPTKAPTQTPVTVPLRPMAVERVFPKLNFRRLTNLVQPDDALNLLFVTEQAGLVRAFVDKHEATGSVVFLDITDRVNEGGNEEGLLGLAFDPNYQSNGYFYVYYSAEGPRRSVLSRFSVSPNNPVLADTDRELIILEVPQPYTNHNGGQLAFGPDSYLYIGLGDGGKGGDPHGNGQNTATLLGSILRIDVSRASEGERYRIPHDNPLVGVAGARAEIWAYGLRNPWRFSFDRETRQLWTADVGQNSWEEVDLIERGLNYGWNVMEGAHCFSPRSGCSTTGLRLPVAEYNRSGGCSVTGGYVYRLHDIPSLTGAYVYGDFCSGKIWGLRHDGESVTEHMLLTESGLNITSFGQDRSGSLYLLSRDSGIYRLVPKE